MSTYKGIQGYTVQKLSSDPTAEDAVGQLFYNSTSGKFKVGTEGAGAWSSATSFTRVGTTDGKFCGTSTATLFAGGYAPAAVHSPPLSMDYTEKYDGTTWTEVADLNTARYGCFLAGTQAAAVNAGGNNDQVISETWDGTSWTETNNLNTGRHNMGIAGTQTSGIAISGLTPTITGVCETYDGTSWTNGTNINTARYSGGGSGASSTSAIYVGGGTPPASALSETWNGSTWTEGNNINTARSACGGFGIVTSALISGGAPPVGVGVSVTEKYDGTSWTEVADMATARYSVAACGTVTSGLIGGGNGSPTPSGLTQECEEWSDPVYTIKTVTVS